MSTASVIFGLHRNHTDLHISLTQPFSHPVKGANSSSRTSKKLIPLSDPGQRLRDGRYNACLRVPKHDECDGQERDDAWMPEKAINIIA